MLRRSLPYLALFIFWAAMFFSRWFWPYDETRYLSVAWEMWQRGDFLVPYLNGEPYSHKPPLLFWLIHAGWWLFGVNDLWPRSLPLFFSWLALAATSALAKKLWPDDHTVRYMALWFLAASMLWAIYTAMLYFDLAVAACAAWSIWAGLLAREGKKLGFMLCTFFLGLGVLAKGPMVGLVAGPVLLGLTFWHVNERWDFFKKITLCGMIALGIGALWAIPAAISGGEDYAQDILWRQMAGRAIDAFAHARPMWWYAALLPALFAPWILMPGLWQALWRLRIDMPIGFCFLWFFLPFFLFSLLSGKQLHYLLPLFPAAALILGRAVSLQSATTPLAWPSRLLPGTAFLLGGVAIGISVFLSWLHWIKAPIVLWPQGLLPAIVACLLSLWLVQPKFLARQVERLGVTTLLFLSAMALGIVSTLNGRFDLRPLAAEIHRRGANHQPLAFVGKYAGEFHYAARLERPLVILKKEEVLPWLVEHQDSVVIARDTEVQGIAPSVCQPYRSHKICLFMAPEPKSPLVFYGRTNR